MVVYISLGQNCSSAAHFVKFNDMPTKNQGRSSCPFDLCITTYNALCFLIENDFNDFFDISLIDNIRDHSYGELDSYYLFYSTSIKRPYKNGMICNTKIGMWFNHESPGNPLLPSQEKWSSVDVFTKNNFEAFTTRYTKRIMSFYDYIQKCIETNDTLLFILYTHVTPLRLDRIISKKFPLLKYKILCQKMDDTTMRMIYKFENFCNIQNDEKMFDSDYQSDTIKMQSWHHIDKFNCLQI